MSAPGEGGDDSSATGEGEEGGSILPFTVPALDVRGRAVHLGGALDTIIRRHGYPEPVARLLGEALALTALLGSSLKFDGRFILQAQTDGPVGFLVADFSAPDGLRGYARFDPDAVAAVAAEGGAGALLGHGHLGMTVDQGAEMQRYQGIVPLDGGSLEDAAHRYFEQSEQIPTRVRLAVAEVSRRDGGVKRDAWRAGGVMLQFLPEEGGRVPVRDLDPGDAPDEDAFPAAPADDDDAWAEAQLMAATIEDHELTDPEIPAERLLFRLFHERGVRVFERRRLVERCRCSRERVAEMLAGFTSEERTDMTVDGAIVVTCEFCSTSYRFDGEG